MGVPRADAACRATRGGCVADKECVAKANGYCTNPGDGMGCRCQYGCKTDADCGKDEVCLCGEPAGTCVAATCSDSSCAPPSRCSTYHNGCFYVPFACLERIRFHSVLVLKAQFAKATARLRSAAADARPARPESASSSVPAKFARRASIIFGGA